MSLSNVHVNKTNGYSAYIILLYSICVCTDAHICVYTSDEEAEIISRIRHCKWDNFPSVMWDVVILII